MTHKILLPLFALCLLIGCSAPPVVDHHEHHHNHEGREVTGAVPTVDLVVHKDPKSGYNLQIITTNFRFAPENASSEHIEGEGHAHVYVDDVKINRIYGEWYHLGLELAPGIHEVRVDINGNDHTMLLHDGEPIEDRETITVE